MKEPIWKFNWGCPISKNEREQNDMMNKCQQSKRKAKLEKISSTQNWSVWLLTTKQVQENLFGFIHWGLYVSKMIYEYIKSCVIDGQWVQKLWLVDLIGSWRWNRIIAVFILSRIFRLWLRASKTRELLFRADSLEVYWAGAEAGWRRSLYQRGENTEVKKT